MSVTVVDLDLILLLILVAGFALGSLSNWTSEGFLPNGFAGVMQGAAASFYAYIGFEGVACAGEETENPSKVIPKALFTSLGVMFILYLFQAAALTLMVPWNDIDTEAAFPEAFERLGYPGIAGAVSMGILIGLIRGLINGLYTMTRIIYAMAQDGLIFNIFAKVNERRKTLLFGEIFFGILSAVLAVIFDVAILVEFLSVGTLIAYTIVSASSIILYYQTRVVVYDVQRLKHLALDVTDEDLEEEWRAGSLKKGFRWLKSACFPFCENYAVDIAVWSYALLCGCLVSVFVYGAEEVEETVWWAILLIVLLALAIVASYLVIIAHHKRKLKLPFEMLSVPFIPALSILLNITLMFNLSAMTWLRLAIWFVAGLIIYFTYGIWHSNLQHPERLLQVEPVKQDIVEDPNFGETDLPSRADLRNNTITERTPLLLSARRTSSVPHFKSMYFTTD